MTITSPTTWSRLGRNEIQPDEPITSGEDDELSAANQANTRNFAASIGQVATLQSNRQELGADKGIPDLTTSYVEISRGKMRVWGDSQKFRVAAYGRSFNVRISVGGIYAPALTASSTLQWHTGLSGAITGATIDGNGLAEVIVEASRQGGGSGTNYVLEQITLNEVAVASVDYPDSAAPSEQGVMIIHDETFEPDQPLDAFALQVIDDNAGRIELERTRRSLTLFSTKRPHKISSVHWRLDGPYMISSPPWADRATVVVTARLSGTDPVEIMAMSEHEKLQELIATRPQTVSSSSFAHFEFENVRLIPDGTGESTQLIWIAFRSEVGTSTAVVVEVGAQAPPWKLYCEDLLSSYIPDTSEICAIASGDDQVLQYKSLHRITTPDSFFDIACVGGEESSITSAGDNVRQPVTVSPSPHTGITSTMAVQRVYSEAAAADVYLPVFEVYNLGAAIVSGVYIEARGEGPIRRKLAYPGGPPSAGLVGEIIDRINVHTQYLTPQILTRIPGARDLVDDAGTGPTRVFAQGHYLFIGSESGANTFPVEVPISENPNAGAGSGLLSGFVCAQICYMVCIRRMGFYNMEGHVGFYFGTDDPVEDYAPVVPYAGGDSGYVSPTVADATLASANDGASLDPVASSPEEATEWAYTQQYTWPTEGYRLGGPWRLSPVIRTPIPLAFPNTLTLYLKNSGGRFTGSVIGVHTTLIIAGIHVWISPRE